MPRTLPLVIAGALAACDCPPAKPDGPASPWSEGSPLPAPRLESGVTALGQRIIVLGGFDQNITQGLRITTEVLSFDPEAEKWSNLPEAPVAWTHANVGGASATLYLLGGHDTDAFLARGESYALDLGQPDPQWRTLAPIPPGMERGAAAVVVSPPHIFLIGGASTSGALASVLDYDFSTDTWSTLPDLPGPRSHAAAMRQMDGTLIVAGGVSSLDASRPLDDVWALRPKSPGWEPSWEPRAPLGGARGGCAFGVVFGQLICAGGEAGSGAVDTVETYDPNTDTWTTRAAMPEPRAGARGAVVGGRLFVPGGAATLQLEPTTSLYVFTFLDTLQP